MLLKSLGRYNISLLIHILSIPLILVKQGGLYDFVDVSLYTIKSSLLVFSMIYHAIVVLTFGKYFS